MNSILFLLITMFLTLMGCGMINQYKPDPEEEIVHEILLNSEILIEKKYNIKTVGSGAAMPGGNIKKLTLSFDSKSSYSKKDLRIMLIGCANELLNQINTNDKIQKYLVKRPFTIENVQLIIFNYNSEGRYVYDPEIFVAEILGGILTYQTKDPKKEFGYKNTYTETYEEALQALLSP